MREGPIAKKDGTLSREGRLSRGAELVKATSKGARNGSHYPGI
jgi:hypothetical protein